jgi:hypothetical protein
MTRADLNGDKNGMKHIFDFDEKFQKEIGGIYNERKNLFGTIQGNQCIQGS